MSNLVHNEQVKLAATFWNNLGVAALVFMECRPVRIGFTAA
jgi:hypothetical protein